MNLKELFAQIKVLLSGIEETQEEIETTLEETTVDEEVTLAQELLVDGVTTIESSEWVEGAEVFIVVEDGENVPLPIGNYELQNGMVLVVEQEGIIASIGEMVDEGEAPEDSTEQAPAEPQLSETELRIQELEGQLVELNGELSLSRTTIEELQSTISQKDEEINGLNVQLSKLPAAKPVKKLPKYIETQLAKTSRASGKVSTFDKILQNIGESKNQN